MTIRQVRILAMNDKDFQARELPENPTTKLGKKLVRSKTENAVANLLAGRRWDR